MDQLKRIFQAFGRRKTIDPKRLLISRFKRNLNIFDLLGIGVGSCLGIGVYVVITYVIKNQAGPSAVLSVMVAGIAAFLSGLCYSEFSTRLPQTGSSYVYIYASLGELSAFVVGWSMLLEYILLVATTAKAWSQYFDGLLNGTIHSYIHSKAPLSEDMGLCDSPDVLSCAVTVLIGSLLICNSKVSTAFSFLLTILNSLVIFCIICVGFFHVKHENWTDPPGFFPFGMTGVFAGASTLFCIFSCVDTMCSTSEETKEPLKMVPSAVTVTSILSFILLLCVTSALTLSYPWYQLQNSVAIPAAFQAKGVNGSYYVFSIGGLIGLTASMVNTVHGIPRILFSMKIDRLIYPCCMPNPDSINGLVRLVIFPLTLSCVLSLFCTLNLLIQMMSLGTLIAHTCVGICVLNLRYQSVNVGLVQEYEDIDDNLYTQSTEFMYQPFLSHNNNHIGKNGKVNGKNELFERISNDQKQIIFHGNARNSTYQKMESIINDTPIGSQSSLFPIPLGVSTEPTSSTSMTSSVSVIIFIISSTVFSFVVTFASDYLAEGSWWTIASLIASVIVLIICTVTIVKQPQNQSILLFKTPYVPFVPLLSIFINMLLMSALSYKAWLRFSIWLFIGLIFYFVYGIRHSAEKQFDDQEVILYEITEDDKTA